MRIARLASITVLATALVALTVIPARAQVGVMAGWNYSDPQVTAGDVDVDVGHRSGFNIGLFTSRGDLVGYMVGLYYSQRGFDIDTASVKLDYVEVPALARLTLPFVRVYGGVNLGFEINCEAENFPFIGGAPFLCETDTESLELGWKVGAGGKLLIFSLDIAYVWGSTDVLGSDVGSIKHRVFQIDLGLTF
ncbi:MAG: PorT family protein [Gemmatimonadetes bacterium]|uniref:PorT family protein n=1 Tax=Candidatus Kutchimonas denitrificans TaxID=3056748 RepID=A0AAE4Z952_9BACT|nr:PorT family protein [Gemmatimonadota bacterium]NIR74451.1 PorT family protein [Candidatus Kutchimonas denitrificans]NIS00847.1 PorT family protein [Gemmatimonadota bacterium]NIT66470.1 PorT family protein [Gemmatimonadota bacterium]NIU52101.1 outer membrane beta-barrel protein [Gemmatimonadota bacterium]